MLEFGAEALDRIGVFSPELNDEIAGIAAGSGLAPELIGALNARTELLAAGRGECSTIACLGTATSSGTPIGVQTWDWHDELSDSWMRWTIDHPGGHRVETMTEAGIVGKVGVSSEGVAILMNILGHRDDGPPIGVPVHVLNRARARSRGRRSRGAGDVLQRDHVGLERRHRDRRRRGRRRRLHRRAVSRGTRVRDARRARRARPHQPLRGRARPPGRHDGARGARLGAAARPRPPRDVTRGRGCDRRGRHPGRASQPPRRLGRDLRAPRPRGRVRRPLAHAGHGDRRPGRAADDAAQQRALRRRAGRAAARSRPRPKPARARPRPPRPGSRPHARAARRSAAPPASPASPSRRARRWPASRAC